MMESMGTRAGSATFAPSADGRHRRIRAGSAVVLLLAPLLALRAQEEPGPEAASAPPVYEVEIIVFRNLDQHGITPEAAVAAAGPAAGSVEPTDTESGGLPDQADTVTDPAFAPLTPQSMRLDAVASRLRRGSAYQLIYHGGWVQSVQHQNLAQQTPLPADASAQGLSGGITLYRERYLHVLVDIALQSEASPEQRIREGRRLRGQTAQYFDDPQFGVILAVRPVSASDTDSPDETDDP